MLVKDNKKDIFGSKLHGIAISCVYFKRSVEQQKLKGGKLFNPLVHSISIWQHFLFYF